MRATLKSVQPKRSPPAPSVVQFGRLFDGYLHRAGFSYRSFGEKVKLSHAFIHYLASGQRTPPVHKLKAWKGYLKLSEAEWGEMLSVAQKARSESRRDIGDHLRQMEQTVEALKANHRAIVAALETILVRATVAGSVANPPSRWFASQSHALQSLLDELRATQALQ